MDLGAFRVSVLVYCYQFEARERSGIRTPRGNKHVKGVTYSAHLVGLGADVVYFERPPLEHAKRWAQQLGLKLVREGDHDHLQPLDWKAG